MGVGNPGLAAPAGPVAGLPLAFEPGADDAHWLDGPLRALLGRLSPGGAAARLTVTIFHRVHAQPDPLFPHEVHAAQFDRICAWLKAWFRVLPLDEAVRRLRAGTLPPRALAITFDDGYADNHDVALPILRAHGLPATFYIATGFIGGGRMFNDTVIETLRRAPDAELDVSGLGLGGLTRLTLGGGAAAADWSLRSAAIGQVLGAVKYLALPERIARVQALAERAGVAAALPDDLMMRREQVQALAAAGMQIGAHTVSHPILMRLDDAAARAEIAGSRHTLQDWLNQPVTQFAYPNGRPGTDYGPRDVALVRELGFEAAVSTAQGACVAGDDPHQLPRFVPWDASRARWALKLARNLRQRGGRL